MAEVAVADAADVDAVTALGGTLLPLNGVLGSERMRMVIGVFRPAEGLKLHLHEHTEELYYVIEGMCRVRFGDDVLELRKGQAVKIPPGTPHRLYNHSSEVVRVAFVLAPAGQDMVVLDEEIPPL